MDKDSGNRAAVFSRQEFNEGTKKHSDFRKYLTNAWIKSHEKLKEDYPIRGKEDLKARYKKAEFNTLKDLNDIEYIWDKAGLKSKQRYSEFINGKAGYDTYLRMLCVFEPLVSAKQIWDLAMTAMVPNSAEYHESIDESIDELVGTAILEGYSGRADGYGAVLQLRQFGKIGRDILPSHQGIPPEYIRLEFQDVRFGKQDYDPCILNKDKLAELEEGERNHKGANGDKFCLVRVEPNDVSDAGSKVSLKLKKTDHFTILSCLESLRDTESEPGIVEISRADQRAEHANLDPEQHRVPHAFCLHYILRFDDESFLVFHRDKRMQYDPLKVSLSGEEQLHPADLDGVPHDQRVQGWINRAFLEEVIGGGALEKGTKRRDELLQYIEWARCLSLVYEERSCGFALTCFIQLNITRAAYVEEYRINLRGGNHTDWEGSRYSFDKNDLRNFFHTGHLALTSFSTPERKITATSIKEEIDPTQNIWPLHNSSLHRLILAGLIAGVY